MLRISSIISAEFVEDEEEPTEHVFSQCPVLVGLIQRTMRRLEFSIHKFRRVSLEIYLCDRLGAICIIKTHFNTQTGYALPFLYTISTIYKVTSKLFSKEIIRIKSCTYEYISISC